MKNKINIGIILAGGLGARFGGLVPKQYIELCDKEIIAYSIEAFRESRLLNDTIVVTDESRQGYVEEKYNVIVVTGGNSKNASLKNALDYIYDNCPECNNVFINDAARPLITSNLIDMYLGFMDSHDYVHTASYITDGLGTLDGHYADRTKYILIQSPEAYKFSDIYPVLKSDSPVIHVGHELPGAVKAYRYFGYRTNFKVTYPEDIVLLEALIRDRNRQKLECPNSL